jgi:hypothetical protein
MSKVLPLDLDRQIAETELLVEYLRDEAEQYRRWHEAAPDSPKGMTFVLYCELAEERAAHAKVLRAQLAALRPDRQVGVAAPTDRDSGQQRRHRAIERA